MGFRNKPERSWNKEAELTDSYLWQRTGPFSVAATGIVHILFQMGRDKGILLSVSQQKDSFSNNELFNPKRPYCRIWEPWPSWPWFDLDKMALFWDTSGLFWGIESLEINKLERPFKPSLLPGEAIWAEHLSTFLLLAENSTGRVGGSKKSTSSYFTRHLGK